MEDTLADKPEGKPKAEKDAVIKEAWINQAQGFGSKMSLIREAKALDPSIKTRMGIYGGTIPATRRTR